MPQASSVDWPGVKVTFSFVPRSTQSTFAKSTFFDCVQAWLSFLCHCLLEEVGSGMVQLYWHTHVV